MLQRAVTILEKEMAGGASMMQLKSAANLEQALNIMAKASAISVADGEHLTALLRTTNDDSDTAAGAPAAEVYERDQEWWNCGHTQWSPGKG